jgi:hypothetical protein
MINPTNRWIINTTVDYTEEKFQRISGSGVGRSAKFTDQSLGWFVRLVGSNESFFISETEPDLHAGDKVRIIMEKVGCAKPR